MNMQNRNIDYCELSRTVHGETAAETEIILPDYLPGVLKLVRTEAVPYIKNRLIRGDRVFVEGSVEFRVLYLPENDEGMRCVAHRIPFSYSSEIKAAENSRICVESRISYANTRALSPQKLYVKATVEITINVFSPCVLGITEGGGDDVAVKSKSFILSDAIGGTQRLLKLSDEIEAEPGVFFGRILRYDATFTDGEKKIVSNKIIVKANMLLTVVYIDSQTNKICVLKVRVPVSQVLEMRDVTENTHCDICFTVADCDMNIHEGADGKNTIEYDIEINVSVECHSDTEVSIPVDAFLLGKNSECVKKTVSVQNIMLIDEPFDVSETLSPDEPSEIYDVSVYPAVMSVLYDTESRAVISQGVFNCNILYKTIQGDIVSSDKALPFRLTTNTDFVPSSLKSSTRLTVENLSYTFNGTTIDLKLSGKYGGSLICKTDVSAVSGVEESENDNIHKDGLILYYANAGDSVWSIAKKYAASPDLLIKNNGLSSDVLTDGRMIYI